MYRVFLDEVELVDIPNGIADFEIEVIREDGFNSTDQILRDKSATTLTFHGDGYRALCAKRRSELCGSSTIRIQYYCQSTGFEDLFRGIIPLSFVEFSLKECTAKTSVRDNSFTGLIKDYLKTEIPFFTSRTKNCEGLSLIDKQIYFGLTAHKAFDVLDAMNYLIHYITDNQIDVVSNTLTTDKLAFTPGYNLHNTTGAVENVYPKIMFNTLFAEIRKKRRIYMVIEYNGIIPQLRIEVESYSFDNTQLLSFPEVPFDAVEKFDRTRLFNSIEVGSNNTELQDASTGGFIDPYPDELNDYQPLDSALSWDKKVYGSCGACSAENDSEQNKLDLVSSWIIDSDVIVEALSAIPTTNDAQYQHDGDIFLFEYEEVAGVSTATLTLDVPTGKNIYNYNLRNGQVIDNWLGYVPSCISLEDSTENYFLVKDDADTAETSNVESSPGSGVAVNNNYYGGGSPYEEFDNGNNVTGFTFTAPVTGSFIFRQKTTIHYSTGGLCSPYPTGTTYRPFFVVYDNLLAIVGFEYGAIITPGDPRNVSFLDFTSQTISLTAGYTVTAGVEISVDFGCVDDPAGFAFFPLQDVRFELTRDASDCSTSEGNTDSKPYILEFSEKLCYSDLKAIRANKKGYISVKGYKYWIRDIKWREKKATEFVLFGNETQCACD